MAYEIKPPLWGYLPDWLKENDSRLLGQLFFAGFYSNGSLAIEYGQQVWDCGSQTFISPSMQARDFTPFAKELIETGTAVLNPDRGRLFMWSLPPFSFKVNVKVKWGYLVCGVWGETLQIVVPDYTVLLTPYIYVSEISRLSLNIDKQSPLYNNLYLSLAFLCMSPRFYATTNSVIYGSCGVAANDYLTSYGSLCLRYSTNTANTVNCSQSLTLAQLLGLETWTKYENGFDVNKEVIINALFYGNRIAQSSLYLRTNMFLEGTSAIRARVFLPELFQPVGDQPAIFTTSSPIISGCIVRFVKNTV